MNVEQWQDIGSDPVTTAGWAESLPMSVSDKRFRRRIEVRDPTLNAKYRIPFGFQAPKGGENHSDRN